MKEVFEKVPIKNIARDKCACILVRNTCHV